MEYSRPKGCPERRAVQGPERYRQRHPANRPASGWRVPRKGIRAGPAVRVCVRRRGHSTLRAVSKPSVRSLYPRNRHRDGADKTLCPDQGPQRLRTAQAIVIAEGYATAGKASRMPSVMRPWRLSIPGTSWPWLRSSRINIRVRPYSLRETMTGISSTIRR